MARIRTVKPEYWSSPDTAACEDPWARLLFIAMWNWADDQGRGTANPKELAGFAFPNDEHIDSADIRRMLGGIHRAFGVILYKVDGRPYFAIPSWDDHQKIDKRSAGKFPGPDAGVHWDPDPDQCKQSASEDPPELPPTPRRKPGAGTGEQGNRGSTTSATDADAPAETEPPRPKTTDSSDPAFEEFWSHWPRKIAKDAARTKYRAALRKGATPERILSAVQAQTAAWKSEGKETRYIPHASTWLNQGRYDDEIENPNQTVLSVVPDLPATFEDIRDTADLARAEQLLGHSLHTPAQPPSDRTPPQQWRHDRAVDVIDAHEAEIRDAIGARRAG